MCFKRGEIPVQIWMGYVSAGARIRRTHVNQSTDMLLVRSIRTVAKIPLIFLNIIAIMFKLILG
uniref:Uncharacterized protein n=1 Tax=Anopheles funestus TaxID=62324 RepID=A0A182R2L6_ANOFN